jgi:small subunit ribosomal protein S18
MNGNSQSSQGMSQNPQSPNGHSGGPKRKIYVRKKVCKFCVDKNIKIDYKDIGLLRQFTTEAGKILARRITGTCATHQRKLTSAIKIARTMALVPFTSGHTV